MKPRSTALLILVLTLVLGLAVAACAPAAAPTPTPTKAPAAATPTAAAKPATTTAPAVTPTAASPASKPQSLNLKVASPYPETHLLSAGTKAFIQIAEKKSDGRIKLQPFWGGTLVKAPEVLDSTSKGVVDVVTGLWIYDPGKVPLGSFEYNFLFNDPKWRNQSKIKREMFSQIPELNAELAKFKIAPSLQFGPITSYDIISRKPVRTMEDLRGLRIAHTPTEYVPAFGAVGAVSVVMPATDMYTSLERGVVDAAALPIELLHGFKLHEVAKNYTVIGLSTPAPVSLWVNLDVWGRMTAEDKKLFDDAAREAEEMYITNMEGLLVKAKEDFKNMGVTMIDFPAAEKAKFVAALPDLPAEWAKKMEAAGAPGWKIVDKYLELSTKEGWEFPRKWGVR